MCLEAQTPLPWANCCCCLLPPLLLESIKMIFMEANINPRYSLPHIPATNYELSRLLRQRRLHGRLCRFTTCCAHPKLVFRISAYLDLISIFLKRPSWSIFFAAEIWKDTIVSVECVWKCGIFGPRTTRKISRWKITCSKNAHKRINKSIVCPAGFQSSGEVRGEINL